MGMGMGMGVDLDEGGAPHADNAANSVYKAFTDEHQVNQFHKIQPSVRAGECFDAAMLALQESFAGSSRNDIQLRFGLLQQALQQTLCLANEASLLPAVYFPTEQTVSIYAPYWIPILIPILRAGVRIYKATKNNSKE